MGSLAALDPGRSKCGLVRTDPGRTHLDEALILDPSACRTTLIRWHQQQPLAGVVLGNGTGSRQWQRDLAGLALPVLLVDEWGTTLAARQRYWQLWPARGWRRLLPMGLRLPPRDLDDLAAQILLEHWLQRPLPRGERALGPRLRSGPAR
jgi:RNase H-fold protein (predicted Holliday junction resolvase)